MRQLGVDNSIMETQSQYAIRSIREKAERSGFKLADVAHRAEIDPAQVSRWATGKTIPLYSSVIKLMQACDDLATERLKMMVAEK
jgi:transcriptional regulator with XRE-family HTH domain